MFGSKPSHPTPHVSAFRAGTSPLRPMTAATIQESDECKAAVEKALAAKAREEAWKQYDTNYTEARYALEATGYPAYKIEQDPRTGRWEVYRAALTGPHAGTWEGSRVVPSEAHDTDWEASRRQPKDLYLARIEVTAPRRTLRDPPTDFVPKVAWENVEKDLSFLTRAEALRLLKGIAEPGWTRQGFDTNGREMTPAAWPEEAPMYVAHWRV